MSWADVYLVCFLVGFGLSLVSLVAGGGHWHLPHLGGHGVVHAGSAHAGSAEGISPFNFGTLAAFLAWFGGSGYLLEHYFGIRVWLALAIAILSGLAAAALVFWFLARLASREQSLDPADYEMIGVLGHISSPIRAGGTGELIFSQAGARCVAGARSEDGSAIPKGAEVVVTRYEKGIAYVRRWEDLAGSGGFEAPGQKSEKENV